MSPHLTDSQSEFAPGAPDWPPELSRRRFLQIMGASIALAGTSGCTRTPPEHIVPYLKQPEEIIPGRPLYFASALTLGGYARGVLVETHEGRPTKIEGNPLHPASLGATDAFVQAELLTLYDPERSQTLTNNGQTSTWEIFLGELTRCSQSWKTNGGAGLRILTRHETSPTFLDQIQRLLAKYPAAKWHEYEPIPIGDAICNFDKAEVIVSLGADFLCSAAAGARYARDFAKARTPNGTMNRLYVIESTPTLTGAMADHRILLRPDELEKFGRDLQTTSSKIAAIIARDLQSHAGRSLVLAGESVSPALHAIARQLNDSVGNVGVTIDYSPASSLDGHDLSELVADIRSGTVGTLLICGGNPVYDAPADFEFAQLLGKIARSIHIGLYADETAGHCHWHVPLTHELESWSDARAFDGTITIMQPMIEPLFAGRSRYEVLSALLEEAPATSYDIVRAFWQSRDAETGSQNGSPSPQSSPRERGGREAPGEGKFEQLWRKSLHDGISAFSFSVAELPAPASSTFPPITNHLSPLTLLIRADPRMYDGRYANNAWLQELPNPLTQIVWDNAALISPATAKRFALENGDVVSLKFRGRSARAPIWILPGQADECVTITLGYGRTTAGSVGNGVGFNAYALRTSDAPWGGAGLELEKTGEHHDLVTTQHHWEMHEREQVRVGTFAQFQKDAGAIAKPEEPPPREEETLYRNFDYTAGHQWGMSIDLNTCIGCGTCTIACQAENNIPVVGKEQMAVNREMHWIRVDRYITSEKQNPSVYHQPVACMHCETAPCELVCPVAATVHSSEGLNQMIYNRCIGTRYCSNNCPYKVRRFNFLEYDANRFEVPITRKLMRNPNVTVRSRGVMEKCTYCIQRINSVKIEAEKANRAIRDGEIIPACAQACPADAIIFGDLNDASSRAAKLRKSPLTYGLLAELNTRPRTTYLAKLRNPNPELEE